jgi:hypothetical protein
MACSTASRRIVALAVGLTAAAFPAASRADPPSGVPPSSPAGSTGHVALAQSLFDRGRQLLEAGQTQEACRLFAESYRLDAAGGTLLNLALCHERGGKLASAYATYSEALSQAIRDGRDDRRDIADQALRDIAPRLSRVTLDVPEAARVEGLEIRVDETVFTSASWGHPTPIDGGPHSIEVTAPGRTPWTTQFDVAPEHERRVISIPTLAPDDTGDSPSRAPASADGGLQCSPGWTVEGRRCVRSEQNPNLGVAIASFVAGGVAFWGAVGSGYVWLFASTSGDASTADVAGPVALGCGAGMVTFITLGIVLIVTGEPEVGMPTSLRVGPTGAWLEGSF